MRIVSTAASAAVTLLLAAGCSGSESANPSDTGNPLVPPESPGAVVVSFVLDEPSPPFALGDRLVLLGSGGTVNLVDPETKEIVAGDTDAVAGIAAVIGDSIVAANDPGVLVLDASLQVTEEYPAPLDRLLDPDQVVANPDLIAASYGDRIVAYARGDGSVLWERPAESDPALDESEMAIRAVYLGGDTLVYTLRGDSSNDDLTSVDVAVDVGSGEVLGRRRVEPEPNRQPGIAAVVGDGTALLTEDGDFNDDPALGWLRRVDLAADDVIWEVQADSYFDDVLVEDDMVYAPNQDENLYIIDLETGSFEPVPMETRAAAAPVLRSAGIIIIDAEGEVRLFDPDTGDLLGSITLPVDDIDSILGTAVIGDTFYVTVTSRGASDNSGRANISTLYGIDVNQLTGSS